MNGLDTVEWDPATDPHLSEAQRFGAATAAAGKAAAKAALQERYGLALRPDAAVIGLIGRLADQKGVDLVLSAVPALMAPPAVTGVDPRAIWSAAPLTGTMVLCVGCVLGTSDGCVAREATA